jgi:hypothetical protein
MERENRILSRNWDLYDTRHVVYKTKNLSATDLEAGYNWSYNEFYKWSNIFKASLKHDNAKHKLKHLFYTGGWKKFEPLWNFMIKTEGLNKMLPLLENILSKVNQQENIKKSLNHEKSEIFNKSTNKKFQLRPEWIKGIN